MAKKSTKRAAGKARTPSPKSRKYVYFFGTGKADGNRTMKDLLGGKGAGLAEMTNAGLPVPPGLHDLHRGLQHLLQGEGEDPRRHRPRDRRARLKKLEKAAGATLGSTENPLLVSVRSGAKFSMPGMMDTILNLGLNDDAVEGLKRRTQNGRFAFDSYRRFIQMFGSVVLEIPKDAFEHEFEGVKKARGAKLDTDLDEPALRDVVERYKKVVKERAKRDFPQDPARAARRWRATPCSARG